MKKYLILSFAAVVVFFISSCKADKDPDIDNPDVESKQIDAALKSFYLKPTPSSTFEQIYSYNFPNVSCGFDIDIDWYDPDTSHGIYMHFNNNVGDVLLDANGFIKSFDSAVKIDSTLAGTWSGPNDGIFSLDYVSNPSVNKGNLAGQGDKYIVFRAFSYASPQLKYYGWLRVTVSANGRDVKVMSIGFQKNPNSGLKTGDL